MILSRRLSLITASIIFSISLVFVAIFPNDKNVFLLLFLAILTLALSFRIFGWKRLLFGSLTPLVYLVSTYFVFIKFPLVNISFKLILTAVFSVFYYYLLLSVNAILISALESKSFPLLRVGKTVIYITTLFAAFLGYTIIYKFEYIFIFYTLSVFIVTFLLSLEYFWSQKIGVENASSVKPSFFESMIISVFVSEVATALSFFPTEAFFRALFASTSFYVLLGLSESIMSHKTTTKMYVEYILILVAVFAILVVA